jgi:octopine/nopaline transport system permease protein
MNVDLIVTTLRQLLAGVPVTLALLGGALVMGLLLAATITAARLAHNRALQGAGHAYVTVVRGTPLIVQIFLIYFGLGQFDALRESFLWPAFRNEYFCAILALSLNTAAYTSEIIRGGILSVPAGQIEAAAAAGMNRAGRLRHIVLPLAIRQMLPAYGNEVVLMVKATSVASVITIMEITGIARSIAGETYAPLEVFTAAGAIYLTINAVLSAGVSWLERRLAARGSVN